MTETLSEALNKAVPKNLDEIIRANRDMASFYLSTDAQIVELNRAIAEVDQVKDEIEDWRFITLDVGELGTKVMLLGDAQRQRESWITSTVCAIDFDTKLVVTANSVYRLVGERGNGEPPLNHLLHVCHWLHKTNANAAKHFDVLNVFY